MKKKVLIDCDPGIDDALALILAFHSPELEVIGITGVNGNVSLEKVMINIQRVLTLIRPEHPPLVARGAEKPLRGEGVNGEFFHGEDGLGGSGIKVNPGEEWWNSFPGSAPELLIETFGRFPGEVTLIAIGPLTNLALALEKDSGGMKKVKEIVVMGGALREKGNITPYAEFNFYIDPTAAQIVMDSGIPIILVPLDATHQVALTPDFMDRRIKPLSNMFSSFALAATGYNPDEKLFRGMRNFFYLHDPLAVGSVITPNMVRKENTAVRVTTSEGEQFGRSIEIPQDQAPHQRVETCRKVDADRFLEIFLSRLET